MNLVNEGVLPPDELDDRDERREEQERARSRETVADIVADLRERAENAMRNGERLVHNEAVANMLTFVADRIEAAAKRDEERAVEHATRHAEAVARDNCRDCVHNPRGKNYEGGNAAAMCDIVTALANVVLPPRGKADEDGWLAWVRAMQAKSRAALADATTEKSSAVGNAAAMREALQKIMGLFRDIDLSIDCTENEAYAIADKALSAPARNCDKMPDIDNLTMHDLAKSPCKSTLECASREELLALVRWLLAPAAERKGEGDGSK